jgi:hypothetical protein
MIPYCEGRVTKLRREFKLLLSTEAARQVCARLGTLQDGGLELPSRITSVYFDRADLALAARAQRTPQDCLKVRTKEYFPDLEADGEPRVVLEVKRERNGLTQKRRVWVARAQMERVLAGGVRLLPLIAGGSLSPQLAVTYRRRVFQQHEAWRVTVDDQIAYHPVTPALALCAQPLSLKRLEPPVWSESRVVVEVKHLGEELPEWLRALEADSARRYSKFAEGMCRLHGSRLGEVGQGG